MKKEILEFQKRLIKHDISGVSAQLSYFLFLSLFPFLILLYTIFGFFSLPIKEILEPLYEIMPNPETVKIIKGFIQDSAVDANFLKLPIPLVLIIFSASRALHALENYMIKAYHIVESRGYFYRRVWNAFYLLIIIFMLSINVLIPVLNLKILRFLNKYIGISEKYNIFFGKSRWVLSFGILLVLVLFINYFIPNKEFKFKNIIPGSIFSSIVWIISSFVFSYLVKNVFKFSLVYGSLNSIIIIMIWLYISSFILVLGIELNAFFIEDNILGGEDG